MKSRTVYVNHNNTDFAGDSARFVAKACEFESSISIEVDNKKYVNAKSFMGMLTLDVRKGMELHIVSDGVDEEQAVDTMESLIRDIVA